ncbi:MAG: hypothetical protein ACRD8O_22880, partial [Bryobacteraceae bacterium]
MIVLAVVVTFVPWLTGLAFLDAAVVAPFSVLSVLIVSDLVNGALTTADGGTPGLVAAKTTAAVLFGWTTGLVMLLACVVSVSFWNWHGRILFPPLTILLAAAAISLGACGLAGAVIAWLPKSARVRFKLVAVALLLLTAAAYTALPAVWQDFLAAQT